MFDGKKVGETNGISADEGILHIPEYRRSVTVKNAKITDEFLKSEGFDNIDDFLKDKEFDILFKNKVTGVIVDRIDNVRITNEIVK
jgi:hypothetical protein